VTSTDIAELSFVEAPTRGAEISARASADAYGIATVADRLAARAFEFERRHDSRCVFATAYAHLTRRLSAAIDRAGFGEPAWVADLALVFSGYYFRALDAFEDGTLTAGAWKSVFDAGKAGGTSVLEDLVLGMTAHIVNDLPLALCEVGLRDAQGHSRLPDYHRVNDVLGAAIGEIQDAITHRYDPLLGALDFIAGSSDEILTSYGLRLSRALAWYNAQRLLEPDLREAAEISIAKSPSRVLTELFDPPSWSLGFIARGVRWVSGLARRWPAPDRTGCER
jgi:hypothetical protein